MNRGLTRAVLELLDEETDMWMKDMYSRLRKQFPGLTRNQLSATLSALEEYGRVIHLCRGAWASVEYPYR